MAMLLAGHRSFRARFASQRDRLTRLAAEGQSPHTLWIGCSGSRVVPEVITGAGPGDLFVVRNIANVVPPASAGESAVGAVIEYAVRRLQASNAVVCGHTECGGLRALGEAIDATQVPYTARWLAFARSAARDGASRLDGAGEGASRREHAERAIEDAYLATVKANMLAQLENLATYDAVREAVAAGRLTLHGWLYDLHSGELSVHHAGEGWRPLDGVRSQEDRHE